MEAQWGDLGRYRGLATSARGDAVVCGLRLGNVFIGVQPALGVEGDPMRLLFERDLTPHPQYAAFYKWLQVGRVWGVCVWGRVGVGRGWWGGGVGGNRVVVVVKEPRLLNTFVPGRGAAAPAGWQYSLRCRGARRQFIPACRSPSDSRVVAPRRPPAGRLQGGRAAARGHPRHGGVAAGRAAGQLGPLLAGRPAGRPAQRLHLHRQQPQRVHRGARARRLPAWPSHPRLPARAPRPISISNSNSICTPAAQ